MFIPTIILDAAKDWLGISEKKSVFAMQFTSPKFRTRRLSRYKTINGKRYQLHAKRGWKCVGRVGGK